MWYCTLALCSVVSNNIKYPNFSISIDRNTKYNVLRSACPRPYLPNYVVAASRRVSHSTALDDDDNRSIDGSKLLRHHGDQLLLSAQKPVVSHFQRCCSLVLRPREVNETDRTGSVSVGSACGVLRVLSGGDEVWPLIVRLFLRT